MKAERFFLVVQRANSILLLVAGFLAVFFLGSMASDSVARMGWARPGPVVYHWVKEPTPACPNRTAAHAAA